MKNSFLIFGDDPHGPDMASFNAVLQVSGKQYEIIYSDFNLHQYIDSLGRPASPTFGGTVNLAIQSPPGGDSLLFDWMVDPAMELNAQLVLWDLTGAKLKVIKFYNAYCVNLEGHFDATGRGQQAGGSLRHSLRISPQAVDVNGQFHDNDWPGPSPIVDWDWSVMNQQCNPDAVKAQPEQAPASVSGGGPGPKKKPKPKIGWSVPPVYKGLPRRMPPMEPAPPRVSVPGFVPILTGWLVFIAGVLFSPDAGVANEWEIKLSDEDEQRYDELLAKRNRLKAEGKELSTVELRELRDLTEKKYPNPDHRPEVVLKPPFENQKESRQDLIDELRRNGVKFDESKIVRIGRDANGKIIFLEEGNSKAGLEHIMRHAGDFESAGIDRDDIADVVLKAATKGKQVGMQGTRPIYEINYNGKKIYVAVTVGSNGFIVGANPTSKP